jgi:hypothetical protein
LRKEETVPVGGMQFCQFVVRTDRADFFDEFLVEFSSTIGTLRVYDKWLYLSPWVMSRHDLDISIQAWAERGVKTHETVNKTVQWQDLCPLPLTQNERPPDWLVYDERRRVASLKSDTFRWTVLPVPSKVHFSSMILGKYVPLAAVARGTVRLGNLDWCVNIRPDGSFHVPITEALVEKLGSYETPPILTVNDFVADREIAVEFKLERGLEITFEIEGTSARAKICKRMLRNM